MSVRSLGVPNITVRDVNERVETIEAGSNMSTGTGPETILQSVKVVLGSSQTWSPPAEYMEPHVSTTVTKIVLEYQHCPN